MLLIKNLNIFQEVTENCLCGEDFTSRISQSLRNKDKQINTHKRAKADTLGTVECVLHACGAHCIDPHGPSRGSSQGGLSSRWTEIP